MMTSYLPDLIIGSEGSLIQLKLEGNVFPVDQVDNFSRLAIDEERVEVEISPLQEHFRLFCDTDQDEDNADVVFGYLEGPERFLSTSSCVITHR